MAHRNIAFNHKSLISLSGAIKLHFRSDYHTLRRAGATRRQAFKICLYRYVPNSKFA